MDLKLKTISKSGIGEAIAKAELYRYLNEPEEAESICRIFWWRIRIICWDCEPWD